MINELISALRYKSEGTDIDFKSAQYRFVGGNENDKAEMLKDILAIANAWRDGTGYILLGFKDQRPHPAEIVGISGSIDDAAMQQFVHGKVRPKLTFHYEEHLYDGKTISIISIPKQKRAFYLSHSYGKLKSNVIYVRRGSTTDEAEPPEIAAMFIADSGRTDIRVDLSVLTLQNENLPTTTTHRFLQFTEKFPNYATPQQHRGPFDISISSSMHKDNRNFWREYAKYIQISEALIQIRFALQNHSEVQLTSAKLEVLVEPEDGQSVRLLAGRDLPQEPNPTHDIMKGFRTYPNILANQTPQLTVDESGTKPVCHVRFGSLLPGEKGWSADTFAVVPSAPGKLRLRFRILAAELATPIQMERSIEVTGIVESLDFADFQSFIERSNLY